MGFSQDPHRVFSAGLLQHLAVGVGRFWLTLLAMRQIAHDRRHR